MKHTLYLLLAVVTLLSLTERTCAQELPFADGEKLQYTIHYKCGFSADLAQLKLSGEQDGDNYHLTANISTFRFWDSFFKMRDLYETKFQNAPGLKPVYFHREIQEGNYWAKNWFTWSEDASSAHAIIEKKTRPRRDTTYREDGIIRDIFNLIYLCRAADYSKLEAGQPIKSIMTLDRDLFDITVRFIGRETKKVGSNTYNTVKLGVAVKSRNVDLSEGASSVTIGTTSEDYDGSEKLFFWMSDDENRVPVIFSTSLTVGSIRGRLVEISGNKFPLTSLVK